MERDLPAYVTPVDSYLATDLPGRAAQRRAMRVLVACAMLFLITAPFATVPLRPVWPFIPIYESVTVINDLITAVLLFGQYRILRQPAWYVLACGYLFTALMAISHTLSFPGLFAATGLLGAGPQSTAWLYMMWHAALPLCVLAYAHQRRAGGTLVRRPWLGVAATAGVWLSLTVLATAGHEFLPRIMDGNHYTALMYAVVGSVWALSAAAAIVLWRLRPRAVLDLWLLVVMCAWLADIALSVILNAGRFDLGFYAGRVYGMLAVSYVLLELLLENSSLYAKLVSANRKEQAQAQILLDARNTAQAATEAKAQFLANMSHEIRTPLNAIVGLNYLLRKTLNAPHQQELANKMEQASRHLMGIVNDVLDYSKIEAGSLVLETVEFRLGSLLDELASMISEAAMVKGLRLEIDAAPEVRALGVSGDPLRLRQILLNFLNNAVKFTERGSIRLGVQVDFSPSGPLRCEFTVRDTGIGLSEEQLGRLFRHFEQADASTTRRYGGSGLGLAISKRLAELMHGSVGAESQLGQGACFWLRLPLARASGELPALASTAAPDTIAAPSLRGARLLVAEDNPLNQLVVRALLLETGARVDVASDGRAALDYLQQNAYQLVLLDLQMPEMDGISLAGAIREQPQYANLPLVAMTANATAADRERCLAAGMNDFLPKPVEPGALWNILRRWGGASAPVPTAPADAPAALPELPGVDTAAGVRRVLGNVAAYRRLLRRFIDSERETAHLVRVALAEDDNKRVHSLLHSLAGTAGVIGAERLLTCARTAEYNLSAGSLTEAQLIELEDCLHALVQAVEDALGTEGA